MPTCDFLRHGSRRHRVATRRVVSPRLSGYGVFWVSSFNLAWFLFAIDFVAPLHPQKKNQQIRSTAICTGPGPSHSSELVTGLVSTPRALPGIAEHTLLQWMNLWTLNFWPPPVSNSVVPKPRPKSWEQDNWTDGNGGMHTPSHIALINLSWKFKVSQKLDAIFRKPCM